VVNKEATERTETVRDTVRRKDVTVEPLNENRSAQGDYEDDFRSDFKQRYGSNASATYDMYAPAYQYGYRQASDERYRGKSWDDAESDLRSDYSRNNPKSTWEQMKDAVRYGWDKMTGHR